MHENGELGTLFCTQADMAFALEPQGIAAFLMRKNPKLCLILYSVFEVCVLSIVEEYVTTRVCYLTAKHYASLGYSWDGKCGTTLTVRTEDLPRNSSVRVTKKCDICGKITKGVKYRNVLRDRMFGQDLCSRCMYDTSVNVERKDSYGEYIVRKWLEDNGIKYAVEVRRKGLTGVSGRPLRFDFAVLNDNNDPVLFIEYDGRHHYEPVDYYGEGDLVAKRNFAMQKENDRRKNVYAERVGIPLLRIPYYLTVEDIYELLRSNIDNIGYKNFPSR